MKYQSLFFYPVQFSEKHGFKLFIILLVCIAIAILSMSFIRIDDNVDMSLPSNHPYLLQQIQLQKGIPDAGYIKILLKSKSNDLHLIYDTISIMTSELQDLTDVQEVISAATIKDIKVRDNEIIILPIIQNAVENPNTIESTINHDGLFRKFLKSKNLESHCIHVFLDNSKPVKKIVTMLNNHSQSSSDIEIFYFGYPILNYELQNSILLDLSIVGTLALIALFVIQLWITKKIVLAFILLLNSLIPSILIIPFFIILDLPIQTNTILIPVIIFTISTSYSIHLFRYWNSSVLNNYSTTMSDSIEIIILTGITTLIGFGLLCFSTFQALSKFGAALVIGIFISILISMFILPYFLSQFVQLKTEQKALRNPRIPLVIWICLMIFLLAGSILISPDFRIERIFKKGTTISDQIARFNNEDMGLNQLNLYINSGKEYGIVDIDFYKNLNLFLQKIAEDKYTNEILSIVDLINWFEGKMAGTHLPRTPESDEKLGENIEFLYNNSSGITLKTFINIDYSQIRILITYNISESANKLAYNAYNEYISKIRSLQATFLPQSELVILGNYEEHKIKARIAITEQIYGSIVFIVIIFMIGLIKFKSFKLSILFLIPLFCGISAYLGIMGWLNIPLNGISALALMSILGISCDDAMHFLVCFTKQNKIFTLEQKLVQVQTQSGRPILETTLLLIFGFSALLFSKYWLVTQIGILTAVGLGAGTFTSYFILPRFIKLFFNTQEIQ
ncbi:MAG: MMPL family transporter [Spirochaetales bacterium]|nr:MMPL family transporter [Spirochaetales bacterium]